MTGLTNALTGQGKEPEVFDPVAQGLTAVSYGDGLTAYISQDSNGETVMVGPDGTDVTTAYLEAMGVE